jgi:hypothetical protein
MRINLAAVRFIGIALVGFVLAAAIRTLEAESDLRFRLIDGTLIVISLTSDRGENFDFVLDTGTDTTVVDPEIAPRLLFVPKDQIEVVSLASRHAVLRGTVPALWAGSGKVENVQVLLQDLHQLRGLDARIAGILGQNFLSHFNYLIDYRRRVVRFEVGDDVRNTIDGDEVAIQSKEDRILIASEAQSHASAQLSLVLDSGADSLVLLRTASQRLNLPRRTPLLQVVSGGQVEMPAGTVPMLTVGSEKFREITAILPESEPGVQMGDGLLPTTLFRALYVNNREGFVVFNPRARKN